MSNDNLRGISLELDERNFAHVLSAVALVCLASRTPDAHPSESKCWWGEHGFSLSTAIEGAMLFDIADKFIRDIRWIPGIGGKEHGTFLVGSEIGSNPFISLADSGQDTSPLKTFAANQEPAKDLLDKQREKLLSPDGTESWLFQTAPGISSWGFDARVGSHAYDQGFSSNDEGSGDRDPIYPAVELLSIAAASFFVAIQGWQVDENSVGYAIWPQPVSMLLMPYAVAGRLAGIPARRYRVATRGGSYGKGAAFRYFPEAVPADDGRRKTNEHRTTNRGR